MTQQLDHKYEFLVVKNDSWFNEMYNKKINELYYFNQSKKNVNLKKKQIKVNNISNLDCISSKCNIVSYYFNITMDKISCIHGLKISDKTNIFYKTLEDIAADETNTSKNLYKKSKLYQFGKKNTISTLAEYYNITDKSILDEKSKFCVFFPWDTKKYPIKKMQNFKLDQEKITGIISDSIINMHFIKLKRLYESIKQNKIIYDKGWPDKGIISGFFLVKNDDYRFIVTRGIHRIHTFNFLNYENILVEIDNEWEPIVNIKDINNWWAIKDNVINVKVAEQIFDFYFKTNHN
jgi:hypothetical protein